jgi:hypothetical protein
MDGAFTQLGRVPKMTYELPFPTIDRVCVGVWFISEYTNST